MVTDSKLIRVQQEDSGYALYEKNHNSWILLEDCYETQDEAFDAAKEYGRHISVIFR